MNDLTPSRPMRLESIEYDPVLKVDWASVMSYRPLLLTANEELPEYLLLPEVCEIIEHEEHAQRQLAIRLMFITGARPGELIQLTPAHFHIETPPYYVHIPALKRKVRGRPRKGREPGKIRTLPIYDEQARKLIRSFIVTNKLRANQRLFPVTTRTIGIWVDRAVERLGQDRYPVNVTPKTFRHSFAVNATLHYVPTRVLQSWLGHRRLETTEVYTCILAGDSFQLAKRIAWSLDLTE